MKKISLLASFLAILSFVVACGGSSESTEATYEAPPQKIETLPKSN
jgi:hypothetical protein